MRERTVLERLLPVELVKEVVREDAVAEEQPAAALCLECSPLLHKGAERCNTGAWTDHDDILVRLRQREMLVGLELNAHATAALEPFGHETGGDALSVAAIAFVADRRDQQVRFIPDLAAR